MRKQIDVLQTLIDSGKRAGCKDCPVALAIAAVLNSDCSVHVLAGTVTFWRPGGESECRRLPPPARRFIFEFDDPETDSPNPISFALDIPEWALPEAA